MNNLTNIPDEENPLFMFQGMNTKLLVMALNNEIDIKQLLERELSNRGLNTKGEYVGFNKK